MDRLRPDDPARDPRDVVEELLARHRRNAPPAELRRWAADLREQAAELDRLADEREHR